MGKNNEYIADFNKDLTSLKELKSLSESLLRSYDITKLELMSQVINDWLDELNNKTELNEKEVTSKGKALFNSPKEDFSYLANEYNIRLR